MQFYCKKTLLGPDDLGVDDDMERIFKELSQKGEKATTNLNKALDLIEECWFKGRFLYLNSDKISVADLLLFFEVQHAGLLRG